MLMSTVGFAKTVARLSLMKVAQKHSHSNCRPFQCAWHDGSRVASTTVGDTRVEQQSDPRLQVKKGFELLLKDATLQLTVEPVPGKHRCE